jgi:hypothetical protein
MKIFPLVGTPSLHWTKFVLSLAGWVVIVGVIAVFCC